jgi:hypothetical protein
MLPIENWMILLIISAAILVVYGFFYKSTLNKRLHTLTEEHKVSEPHNDLVLLRKFVEKCWERGYSIPEIKGVLIKKGWNEDTINNVFYKSKVPNAEEKVSRVQKVFSTTPKASTPVKPKASTSVKPKKSRFTAITSKVQKPKIIKPHVIKPQLQLKTLKSEEKVKALKKENKTSSALEKDEDLKIGEGNVTTDEDYEESKEVTKLKKEILKDVKSGKNG